MTGYSLALSHSRPHIAHPRSLVIGKALITIIRRIIHKIMNRIHSRLIGARVLRCRTSLGGNRLLRRIGNVIALIAGRAAIPLENMQQTMPVADFMDCCASSAIMRNRASRHRGRQDIAPVIKIGINRTGRVNFGVWKRAKPQQVGRRRVSDINVSMCRCLCGRRSRVDVC